MNNKLELVAEYAKRIQEIGHPNAISTGIYKIVKILLNDSTKNVTILRVTASWHPSDIKLKSESYLIDISLNLLFARQSSGPKEISPIELLGAIIKVSDVSLHSYEWDNQTKTTVRATWEILSFGDKEESKTENK